MNKLLRALGFVWGAVVLSYIFIRLLFIVPIPKRLSFLDYFREVFINMVAQFIPLELASFIFIIVLFSPCIVFFLLSKNWKKREGAEEEIKKKQLVSWIMLAVLMVVAVCIAVYLNWSFSSN